GSLSISFNYEKYRSGSRAFGWTFFSGTDGSTWTARTAGDQTYSADANNTVISNPPISANKSLNITGLNIGPNEKYYLRWTLTGDGGSSNGQAIGIDDFSITATERVTFTATATNGACPNIAPFITLDVPAATGYKYDITAGTSYSGSMTAAAGGTVVTADPQIVTTFPTVPAVGGSAYAIRLINATGEFKDTTVTVLGIPDNCTPVCASPPAIDLSSSDDCKKGASNLSISFTATNGTATLSSNGAGVLSATALSPGSGSVTYTIGDNDRGKKLRFIAVIADPDGGGPCTAANDTLYIAVPPGNPVFSNIEVCEGGDTRLAILGPAISNTFTWDFQGGITGQGISQNPALANNAPVQTAGSGINVSTQPAGSGCSAAVSSSNYSTSSNNLGSAIAAQEYFEFCVGTPAGNSRFEGVTAVYWKHRASGSGPMNFALVAANNPSVPLLTGTVTTSCAEAGGAIPSNPATCYRIYYWSATDAGGTLRIDSMVITANFKSPSGNYNFYTSDPAPAPVAAAASGASFDPAPAAGTTSNVWVTSLGEDGCNSDTLLVTVKVNAAPMLNIVQPTGLCTPNTFDVRNVALGAVPAGGTTTYHSALADAQNGTNPLSGAQFILSASANIYVRYAAAGCFTTGTINALFYPNASLNLPDSLVVCDGESTNVEIPNAAAPLVTFTWDFEAGINGPGVSNNPGIASDGAVQSSGAGIQVSAQGAGSGCSNAISSNNYDSGSNSLASAVTADEYFEFCIGATQTGFAFQGVKSIVWSNRASNTGPINYALVAANNLTTALLPVLSCPVPVAKSKGATSPH
ncbi:MAG: hypothetical protein RL386_1544, partial [Bacteroidota bacterium]